MPEHLLVDAEIHTPGIQVPKPGDEFEIAITRYTVLRVLEGEYPHSVILVGHTFADFSTPQFQRGAQHRLHLTSEFPERAVLVNPFRQEAALIGVYYCPSFESLI